MGFRQDLMAFLENYEGDDDEQEAPEQQQEAQDDDEGGDQVSTALEAENAALRAVLAGMGVDDVDSALDKVLFTRDGKPVYQAPETEAEADVAPEPKAKPRQTRRAQSNKTAHNGKVNLSDMTLEQRAEFARTTMAEADAAGRPIV